MHHKDNGPANRTTNPSRRAAMVAVLHTAIGEHAEALGVAERDHSDASVRRLIDAERVLAHWCDQAAPLYRDGSATRAVMRVLAVYLQASVSSREARVQS